ncbi:hypothetical protein PQ465_06460 [Sphingobacterium oryzagri]|uniref:Uncharacterized protein n=1 Tax=Sphingobacterium oryzagri TaxID=3025669 RepID=A0ABY7WN97_9SPHI|nr:hypothetical protein [Sphingobacterium sp. KACC 22765]WDF70014.1 hypothetical protein PQ465_06460 [Sphingobacterium sp. KACC 22765]
MKFKNIFLYALGAMLLLFGNRALWDELQAERLANKQRERIAAQAAEAAAKSFEVQKLAFDSTTKKFYNPHPYFQLINASYVNFKALNRGKKTTIELDDDEYASDSN